MPNYMYEKQTVVAFRDQSNYTTAAATGSASDWTQIVCQKPEISFNQQVEDFDLLTGQVGVEGDVVPGSEHGGTITITCPLRSQTAAYDADSDTPSSSPEFTLIAECFGGSTTTALTTNGVASVTDANTLVASNGAAFPIGKAVALGANKNAVDAIVFAKSSTGTTIELLEDLPANNAPTYNSHGVAADDEVFPMITAFSASSQPTPKTFRWAGDDSSHDWRMVGCMPTKCTITMSASKTPYVTLEYTFTKAVYEASGALFTSTDRLTIPPILGDSGGWFQIKGVQDADGTVSSAFLGAANVQLEVECTQDTIEAHSALQGVHDVKISQRRFMVSFDAPLGDSDYASSKHVWDNYFNGQTAFSVSCMAGTQCGRLFAFVIPAVKMNAQASVATIGDTKVGFSVAGSAKKYTSDGDGTVSGAQNSVARIAIG